ncbi:MAG: phosphate ABC transporter permease PstA [Planctomycetaceae bacterium]
MSKSPSFTLTAPGSNVQRRLRSSRIFSAVCAVATYSGLGILAILIGTVVWTAMHRLDWTYITNVDSAFADRAGILAGLWGSFWLISLTAVLAIPIGVGSAVYLEEYAGPGRLTQIIKVNLSNLAGVPSIVYGMLGLTVFVRMFDLFATASRGTTVIKLLGFIQIPIPLGKTVLAGSLTMTLVILPVVIIAAQESLRAVPGTIRAASFALGATRWQTVWHQVVPAALPGIVTGVILSISRAIGETAPLIMVGAVTVARFCPGGVDSPMDLIRNPALIFAAPVDRFSAMPIEIFYWAKLPGDDFKPVAAAGIVVLLVVLLCFNGLAIYVRQRARKKIMW